MATQNSRRLQSILKKLPNYDTVYEVARDLSKAGVLAPHYQVGQEVYAIMSRNNISDGEWRVVRSTITKIAYDGDKFLYYLKFEDDPYKHLYPVQVFSSSMRGSILFDSEKVAQNRVKKLNGISDVI